MRSLAVSPAATFPARKKSRLPRALTIILATGVLVAGGLIVSVAAAPVAAADPGPVAPITATMPTADSLPTVQMDGVAWSQVIIGNTVYVGGQFTNARPAGAAPGTSLTARSNMLSYNLTTGVLNTGFNPAPNQQVYAMAASPDGTRLYVAGMFTSIGNAPHARIAAINTQTGAVISTFKAAVDYTVKSIAATDTTVYVGGQFNYSGQATRTKLAAFSASTGALLGWAPSADNTVNALVVSPDGAVVAGGSFQKVNGQPAYGLAKLGAADGTLLPWNATDTVRDAGQNASITSLKTDGTAIYGSGFVFGDGGNLEGAFSADPVTGNINYLEDCHGDTYDVWPGQDALFTVSHAHYCSTIGGYPQSDPWSINMRHALAFTKKATGTAAHNIYGGYTDFFGTPTPSIMNWFPEMAIGTYTGKSQAAWSITGNNQYVLLGGEFPSMNGARQQGLARFSVKSIAPKKQGPQYAGTKSDPTVTAVGNKVRVAWQANTDEDNDTLSYKLTRDGAAVYQTMAKSNFWTRPSLGFYDSGLVPGTTYRYQLTTSDPDGNSTQSLQISFKAPASETETAYAKHVVADGAAPYWPLNESSGASFFDNVGFDDADASTLDGGNLSLSRGVTGAISGDPATGFDGNTSAATRVAVAAPDTFTAQAWINTTSTTGGKILGFGNSQTGLSTGYDRHIYMDNAGHIFFGVYPGGVRTVNSANTYNDGQWHQISASLGADGMKVYVDDKLVGQRTDVTSGQPFSGYWRVGGDSLGGWPNQPSGAGFTGTIDEVAIYPTVLSRATVDAQWVASGRTSTLPKAPADAYGAAVFNSNPLLFWRLGESSGTTAADSGPDGGQTGIYQGGVALGQPGGIKGTTNTAAGFDGNDGLLASTSSFDDPKNFSEEAWFKTTSTSGGKIIGFGSSQSGTSGNYDRHVYMDPSGAVNFGVWTGQANVITTPGTFNDGTWHHVVATQSTTDGMKLYLDGQLAGTNPQTDVQPYSGYWRVGGDTSWSGAPFIAATIDDVAVYNSVLAGSQVAQHFTLGSTTGPANKAPTASFTSAVSNLSAAFDGSASADADGTVASYAWDFGDGASGTGVKPTHAYAAAGSYTVQLTVTDNDGATGSVSHAVTVTAAPPANKAPTASFTSAVSNLSAAFDGSASADADGTVASYAWDFGDGASGTGVKPTHAYAAAGSYTVQLTVTDNDGATGSVSHAVTVTAAAPANKPPVSVFTVSSMQLTATFDGTGSSDPDGSIASYAWTFGDGGTGTGSKPNHTYTAAGTFPVTLTVTDNGGATGSSTQQVQVTAPPANKPPVADFTVAKTGLTVNLESTSTDSDGTIVSTAWDFGDNTAGSNTAEAHTYRAAGTYLITLTVTDDGGATSSKTVTVMVTAAAPANKPPVAAFSSTSSGLTASLNGSASTDPDGTVKSYSWDFGDNSNDLTTTPTTSHPYAAAGTYQVTLTVTDDAGATNSVVHPVTVSAPAPAVLIKDTFTRTLSGGWGSADTGGPWTVVGANNYFAVADGSGTINLRGPGSGPVATIAAPTASDVDLTYTMSSDKAATGGGIYAQAGVRKVGNSEYRVTALLTATGEVKVLISKIINGQTTTLKTVTAPGLQYAPGDNINVEFRVTGSAQVSLSAKVWRTGTAAPVTWTAAVVDGTNTLSSTGSVSLFPYLSGSASPGAVRMTYDNVTVTGATP